MNLRLFLGSANMASDAIFVVPHANAQTQSADAAATGVVPVQGLDGREPQSGQSKRPPSVSDLTYQVKYQRAFEVAAWALPAVSIYKLRTASMAKEYGMRDNSIATSPTLTTPAKELLTANSSAPYIVALTDLGKGPAVLEVPPATSEGSLYGQVVDHWQVTIADVGPAGLDRGKGGKYLFVHEDYKGEIPEGYLVVKSPGKRILMVFRSVRAPGKSDYDAYLYSKKLRLYYLADGPGEQHFVDGGEKNYPTLPDYDINFFRDVHDIFTYENITAADKYMMGMAQSLGIERGKPFEPDALTRRAIEAAMGDLYLYIQKRWDEITAAGRLWPDRGYTSLMIPDANRGFTYDYGTYVDLDKRLVQWASATLLPRKLPERPATDYLMAITDNTGKPLEAGATYKVTVPKVMPIKQFWALTVYDHSTFAFIYNDLKRTTLSMYDMEKMKKNEEGTATLYVGPKAPQGLESNWIPTVGKRPIPTFRFYGPTEDLYNGRFKMPDFERMN